MKPTLEALWGLVGSRSAYALQQNDGTYRPVRKPVTNQVLMWHLAGHETVGTYIGHNVGDQTMAKTLCFDVDSGPDTALDEIRAIKQALIDELGVPPECLGIEFSGKKGYHLWLPLIGLRPNAEFRRVGRAALLLAGVKSEVYPKQDKVKDLGNLVKLPGGIHKVTGNHNDFIDTVPFPMRMDAWMRLLEVLPEEVHARRGTEDFRFPCVATICDGVKEGSRNNALFHLSAMLRRNGVPMDMVELVVRAVNDKGDPVTEEEMQGILNGGAGPICESLTDEQRCPNELCIKTQLGGLKARPGQLRYAGKGEGVVLEVVGRESKGGNDTIVLFHDDAVDKTVRGVVRGN